MSRESAAALAASAAAPAVAARSPGRPAREARELDGGAAPTPLQASSRAPPAARRPACAPRPAPTHHSLAAAPKDWQARMRVRATAQAPAGLLLPVRASQAALWVYLSTIPSTRKTVAGRACSTLNPVSPLAGSSTLLRATAGWQRHRRSRAAAGGTAGGRDGQRRRPAPRGPGAAPLGEVVDHAREALAQRHLGLPAQRLLDLRARAPAPSASSPAPSAPARGAEAPAWPAERSRRRPAAGLPERTLGGAAGAAHPAAAAPTRRDGVSVPPRLVASEACTACDSSSKHTEQQPGDAWNCCSSLCAAPHVAVHGVQRPSWLRLGSGHPPPLVWPP